jgi:hypothetical protein
MFAKCISVLGFTETLHFGSPELLVWNKCKWILDDFINKHLMKAGIIQRTGSIRKLN